LTQVARARGLQADFESALKILEPLDAPQPEVRVRSLLERGRILNSSRDPDAARPSFQAAFELASQSGMEFLAIDAQHMLAIVAAGDEQDVFNRRALELADEAMDPRARQWRGSLLHNMGWSAFDRGDLDVALMLFKDALVARQEQGNQSEIIVARWCVARVLRELSRTHEALTIQLELADQLTAAGKTDQYVDEEIAACRAALEPASGSGPAKDDAQGASTSQHA